MSDVVLVDAGAVIEDDLYAAGNRVVVLGRIEGDLTVVAFEDVTIAGTVRGDVVGVAGSVIVTGTVTESVRVMAPTLEVTGEVGGDVVGVAWTTILGGSVDGDAVIWGRNARLEGTLGGSLEGQTRSMTLAGRVDENVDITVDRLTVEAGTSVGSDLGYRSHNPAEGVELAEVGGSVVQRLPLPPNIRVRALFILGKILIGLLAAVMGLVLMWALPDGSRRAMASVQRSPLQAWVAGMIVMATPLAAVALAATMAALAPPQATLPLIAVFVPVALAILGVILALAFAAPTAVYPWLGRFRRPGRGAVRAFLYAAAVVILAALIPWVSWLVILVVLPIGIGGWIGRSEDEATEPEHQPVEA
ncbi:MAG TPA: hypothetical protein VLB85_11050 [Acidimicrobiia bacterium]|nr:hypothetical protein [Acidimicrobiia bacterium]